MNRQVYLWGGGALLVALALLVTNWLIGPPPPSDFQAKAERIWKRTLSRGERGESLTLSDVEAVMGRKADQVSPPTGGVTSGWEWRWSDGETGELIRAGGFTPNRVHLHRLEGKAKPDPDLLNRLRAWLGW